MENIAIINILIEGLANKLLSSSKTINELDKKAISLMNVIDKVIDTSTFRVKLCPRSIHRLNKEC